MSLPKEKRYTYEDWLTWDENVRAEIIDGEIYMMALPSQKHQSILGELHGQLWQFLKSKPCKVFSAPFGVRLNKSDETILEPDIVIVCDKSKLDGTMCNGAPDMVIEIVSPSSERRDRMIKFHKYQLAEVFEYWIVDPVTRTIQVNLYEDGRYFIDVYGDTGKIPVKTLKGCEINLKDVFTE